jgi:hypothetical protein
MRVAVVTISAGTHDESFCLHAALRQTLPAVKRDLALDLALAQWTKRMLLTPCQIVEVDRCVLDRDKRHEDHS